MLVTKRSVLDSDMVLQLGEKVVKPDCETDNDRRFKALESEINELKSLLILNEIYNSHENRKQKAEGEIRTRVVASTGPPYPTQRYPFK
jgi:hypothetical protein